MVGVFSVLKQQADRTYLFTNDSHNKGSCIISCRRSQPFASSKQVDDRLRYVDASYYLYLFIIIKATTNVPNYR